jgi:hypothetical protein
MKVLYIIGAIVLLALVGGGGFYGGVVYAQSQSQNAAADFAARRAGGNQQDAQGANGGNSFNRQGGQGNFQQFGQLVARGQVKSVDGNTLQISTAQSVVTVKVDTKTAISKTDAGSLSDLKAGTRVTVFSRETGDSPTASFVQIQSLPGQAGQ